MNKILIIIFISFLLLTGCAKAEGDNNNRVKGAEVDITLSFRTKADGIVYAAWVEDAAGNLIETIFACNSLMKTRSRRFNGTGYLTGDPLPYFKTKNGWSYPDSRWEYPKEIYSVDGVTGASPGSNSYVEKSGTISLGTATEFRVCLEVDKSVNTNDYFQDRPAFTYKSELIGRVNSAGDYSLSLDGWMGNDTTGNPWGQDPRRTITDYEAYKYMQGNAYLPYIIDRDGNYDNLVSNVTVKVE